MHRRLASGLLGLVGCAGPVGDPAEVARQPEALRIADTHELPLAARGGVVGDWPFLDRADFVKRLQQVGRNLDTSWFDLTTLKTWTKAAATMGLEFYDAPVVASLGSMSTEAWIDGTYGNWAARPSKWPPGWSLIEVRATLDWGLPDPWAFQDDDWDQVSISASKPTIICIGSKGVWRAWPFPDDFPGINLVVSPGNGRLIVVPLCSSRGVLVLPFGLDEIEREPPASQWPFRDRDAFAARLRRLGNRLAWAIDEEVLAHWASAACELGLRFRAECDASPTAVDLGHGFSIDGRDAGEDGWMVRDTAGPLGAADLFMPAHDPKIAFLTVDGWTLEPPGTGLAGTILLVSPGNGRLVVIEMNLDGFVSIFPQAFD